MALEKLVCSHCGGSRFVEKDGMLICEFCQTQYQNIPEPESSEEKDSDSKKESKDPFDPFEHEFSIIEKAISFQEQEQALKFADRILDQDPFNTQALLLKGRAWLIGKDGILKPARRQAALESLNKAIKTADPSRTMAVQAAASLAAMDGINVLMERMIESTQGSYEYPGTLQKMENNLMQAQDYLFDQISEWQMDVTPLKKSTAARTAACAKAVFQYEKNLYQAIEKPDEEQWYRYDQVCRRCLSLLEKCIQSTGARDEKIEDYKCCIDITEALRHARCYKKDQKDPVVPITMQEKKELEEKCMEFHNKLHLLDPQHEVPLFPFSGCYIATAVYGGYDMPQVWQLRRFRDQVLAQNVFGRQFISFYYALSPALVKWFGHRTLFLKLNRKLLDGLSQRLEKSGINQSFYQDEFRNSSYKK